MVLIDASVIIDFIAARASPETLWLRRQVHLRELAISTLTLTEVMQGIRYEAQAKNILTKLSCFSVIEIPNEELALSSAQNYRKLRTRGFTVHSTIDCILATFCIEHDHVLLHSDRDFDCFREHLGLRVVHPPEWALH